MALEHQSDSAPTATEPQCMDAEGTRTILQRYLKEALATGELQAPARPGVDYMLSNANTVPNEKGEHVPYVPHVMFFGTHLTNADLGVGKELGPDGQPIGPANVAGEGSPYALVIVPAAPPGRYVHKDADAAEVRSEYSAASASPLRGRPSGVRRPWDCFCKRRRKCRYSLDEHTAVSRG